MHSNASCGSPYSSANSQGFDTETSFWADLRVVLEPYTRAVKLFIDCFVLPAPSRLSRSSARSVCVPALLGVLGILAVGCGKESTTAAPAASSPSSPSTPASAAPSSAPAASSAAPSASVAAPESVAEQAKDGGTYTSDPADPATFLVKLERQACYGMCPVYTLRIDGDGKVTFEGKEHVKAQGQKTKKLDRAALDALASKIESSGYFTMAWKDPCDRVATDNPTVTVDITSKGHTRKIVDYHGNRCIPNELRDLEKEIDRVAGVDAWLK